MLVLLFATKKQTFLLISLQMVTVWYDNSPDSLLDITARQCVLNLDVIKGQIKAATDRNMEIHLPSQIGEKLFQVAQKHERGINDDFINIFSNVTRVRTKHILELSVRSV